MPADGSHCRIGVVDQSVPGWTAASVYSRMILRSLEAVCSEAGAELFFLTAGENVGEGSTTIRLKEFDYLPIERQLRVLLRLPEKSRSLRGEPRLRKLLGLNSTSDLFGVAQQNRIDVLLPLLDLPPWTVEAKTIGWIPDFQHVHLPQFFTPHDLELRNSTISRLAEKATRVMLSSEAAHDDFVSFAPTHADKARVVPFPSLIAFKTLGDDPIGTRIKFNLPEKFVLVANQFWAHKNHALVVDALAILKDKGAEIPVVMTGMPSDHRDPTNTNLSTLLQQIATAGVSSQVMILGLVPHSDLINLMRTAALIIQPSRFEGWSTVVQDAVALGRPLMCSDIRVHREQVSTPLGFFECDSPESLATLLKTHWNNLTSGPDLERERSALAAEREFSRRHGEKLLKVCLEAAAE